MLLSCDKTLYVDLGLKVHSKKPSDDRQAGAFPDSGVILWIWPNLAREDYSLIKVLLVGPDKIESN
jgi:hypothetical protein